MHWWCRESSDRSLRKYYFSKKDEGFHKKEFSSTLIYIYIYYVLAKWSTYTHTCWKHEPQYARLGHNMTTCHARNRNGTKSEGKGTGGAEGKGEERTAKGRQNEKMSISLQWTKALTRKWSTVAGWNCISNRSPASLISEVCRWFRRTFRRVWLASRKL